MKLSDEHKRTLRSLHAAGALRMLAAERESRFRVEATVKSQLERLADLSTSPGQDPRREVQRLLVSQAFPNQEALKVAVAEARQIAWGFGVEQAGAELVQVGGVLTQAVTANAVDVVFESHRAAASIGPVVTASVVAQIGRWERAGEGRDRLPGRIRGSSAYILPRLKLHTDTLSADSFNRATAASWQVYTGGLAPEQQDIIGKGVFRVWSAILDRKTCPVCFGLDGQTVPLGQRFTGDQEPPAHPRCRCFDVRLFIPEAVQRKLPGIDIDYEQLKAEIRDDIRSIDVRSIASERHAVPYIRDSLKRSSPETMTNRLLQRPWAQ